MSCHSGTTSMTHRCYVIRRLDGVDQDYYIDKKSTGLELLDKVCRSLNLLEKDYFGLQFTDKNGDHLWINLRNPLHEQLPQNSVKPILEMRVKYFISPQKLIQPITRVLFYKHLRKELILGRLKVNSAKGARLTALMSQIDKGDFASGLQYKNKIPCSTSDLDNYETRIRREHHKLMGTSPDVAIEKFLNESATLEHYGMEMHYSMNGNRLKMIVGVGPECILVLSPQYEVFERYSYSSIHYTAFHARKFTAMVQPDESGPPQQIEYELKSKAAAEALYRSVTEFHTFFQQDKVSSVVKNAGYCKSILGNFKGQTPDRYYFDITKTHKEVVNYLWPILNPNSSSSSSSGHRSRPLPPPLPPSGFSSMMSLASQRSTRSLPNHSPCRQRNVGSMQRSVSSDNTTFRRVHHGPPLSHASSISSRSSGSRRGSEAVIHPPPSPFNPYASNIDSDDRSSTYISGAESDTYVCMRSTMPTGGSDIYSRNGSETYSRNGSETYVGAGSDTYINSGTSDISTTSDHRPPSPPPMYSEIDPNQDVPSPPPRVFSLHHSNSLTGILDNGASQSNQQHQAFNFDTQEVLTRTRELESELQRLRSAMTCRVCQTEPLGATFCPCGHTVCCFHCANTLSRCWQCDVPIDNVQRMLLA